MNERIGGVGLRGAEVALSWCGNKSSLKPAAGTMSGANIAWLEDGILGAVSSFEEPALWSSTE